LGFVHNKSIAGYGQLTYTLTDTLSVTGGLRYSEDKKRLDSRSTVAGSCAVPVALRNNSDVACSALFKRTDSAVSYTASVNYKPDQDILLYAKTSRGFRGGGFNLRGTSPLSYTPFNPETVTDYEVGFKSELLDRRIRFNAAAFRSNYTNIQRSAIVPNGSGGTASVVSNAASARINGLEAELTFIPVKGLLLSGGLGITDVKYRAFPATCVFPGGPASGTPCDRSGEPFEGVPKTTWNVSGQYSLPVANGDLNFRLDYSHQSRVAFQAITYTQTPNLTPFVTQRAYGLLNGRISWSMAPDEGLTVAVYARNITKEKYFAGILDFVNGGLGYIEGQPGVPRRYGVEVGYKLSTARSRPLLAAPSRSFGVPSGGRDMCRAAPLIMRLTQAMAKQSAAEDCALRRWSQTGSEFNPLVNGFVQTERSQASQRCNDSHPTACAASVLVSAGSEACTGPRSHRRLRPPRLPDRWRVVKHVLRDSDRPTTASLHHSGASSCPSPAIGRAGAG
jgi:TonB dependent receptor